MCGDLTVHHALLVALLQSLHELEYDPQLLQIDQKRPRGQSVVKIGGEILPHKIYRGQVHSGDSQVGFDPHLVGQQAGMFGRGDHLPHVCQLDRKLLKILSQINKII